MRKKLLLSVAICLGGLVIVLYAAVTIQPAQAAPFDDQAATLQSLDVPAMALVPPGSGNPQSPANPLTATLTMPFVPGINQPALLVITVGAVQEAPNTQVELVLPPGASVVQGADLWQVALRPGKTETFTTTIQFGRTGEQEVMVRLRNPLDADNALVGEGALGLTLEEKTGHLGFGPVSAQPIAPATPATGPPAGSGRCLALPALGGISSVFWAIRRQRAAREGGEHKSKTPANN